MGFRRVTAAIAASTLSVAGIGMAAAAPAAAVDVLANCLDGVGDIQEIIASPGDTISISGAQADCLFASTNPAYTGDPVDFFATWPGAPITNGFTFAIPGTGVWIINSNVALGSTDPLLLVAGSCGYSAGCGVKYFITVVSPAGDQAAPAPPPRDVIQEVVLPASESCDAIDDTGLDYGTHLTGGWRKSWSQWPNGGMGGRVCSRTLHYSPTLHRWVLA